MIAVFYHVAMMPGYEIIDDEIWDSLNKYVLNDTDVFVRNECRDYKKYEFPTLEMLREFCINNPEYLVLYVHTKGVTRNIPSVQDWRKCMLYFLVKHYQTCIKLLESYDAVGINYMPCPLPHYQGNFWWARASYIATLKNVKDTLDITNISDKKGFSERHKAEMWLLTGKGKFCMNYYHHRINPYEKLNPPKNYQYELCKRRNGLYESSV